LQAWLQQRRCAALDGLQANFAPQTTQVN